MERRDMGNLEDNLAAAALWRSIGNRRERRAADETPETDVCLGQGLHDPHRWGLSAEAIATVGERLYAFWQ